MKRAKQLQGVVQIRIVATELLLPGNLRSTRRLNSPDPWHSSKAGRRTKLFLDFLCWTKVDLTLSVRCISLCSVTPEAGHAAKKQGVREKMPLRVQEESESVSIYSLFH